jgi:glucose/arabinose dehydrogenase
MKKFLTIVLLSVILLLAAGCSSKIGQEPAPTSVPLSNPQTGPTVPGIAVIPPKHPISLPEGFGITVFAEGLTNPKMMAFGPDDQLYVTEPTTGRVLVLPDRDRDGLADKIEIAAENLIEPSGIAFYQDGSLYVAETTRILRLGDPDGDGYFQDQEIITAGISAGGFTNRTIIFSPDWEHLYLAIGSSCNVCLEQDERRGGVMRYKADGSEGRIFSTGLRHVIGLAFNPANDILWAAVMEREGLKNGLPPETLYGIYIDADGGWPYCHAGRIIDPDYGSKDSCEKKLLNPIFEFDSQSAPYGLEFYTGSQFPETFQNDLFVALHGTGEGDDARGYKILRIPIGGDSFGPVKDFAVGWLGDDGVPWGAPTDLIQGPDGDLFLSDDKLGVIYRIFYAE